MLSLNKLAMLITVAGAVIYGGRLIERAAAMGRVARARGAEPKARQWMRGERLHPCPTCGVYVSQGADCTCGRAGPPRPSA